MQVKSPAVDSRCMLQTVGVRNYRQCVCVTNMISSACPMRCPDATPDSKLDLNLKMQKKKDPSFVYISAVFRLARLGLVPFRSNQTLVKTNHMHVCIKLFTLLCKATSHSEITIY